MSILPVFTDVRQFHVAFGHSAPITPVAITLERAQLRSKWVRDECDELEDDTVEVQAGIDAGTHDEADLIAVQIDAALDKIYFALGTIVETGINPAAMWDIVQAANMAKLHNIEGVMTCVTENGKVVKPEGWQDPHPKLVAEVRRQIAAQAAMAASPPPPADTKAEPTS